MKLIDPKTGLMECTICHETHYSELTSSGYYKRGSWQCVNGCQPNEMERLLKWSKRLDKQAENTQKKRDHIKLQYKKMEIRKQKHRELLERKKSKKK